MGYFEQKVKDLNVYVKIKTGCSEEQLNEYLRKELMKAYGYGFSQGAGGKPEVYTPVIDRIRR